MKKPYPYTQRKYYINIIHLTLRSLFTLSVILINYVANAQSDQTLFKWPEGKQAAISLTFDDARTSQVDTGTSLLDQYGVKATFYVVPSAVRLRLDKWKKAVASGHEIGNHSLLHPCTGNFEWARQKALEDYTLKKMKQELQLTNDSIQILLGVKARSFAYPCGQTFVGRGTETKSYVPLVAKLFVSGRGWLSEGPNDPAYADFAQLTGMEMDGKSFDEILPLIKSAKESGKWLVLAGHEMGTNGRQTTQLTMLKQLIEYVQHPANGIWIAPVNIIADYVERVRK